MTDVEHTIDLPEMPAKASGQLYPRFVERLEAEGVSLPHFVMEEFEAYLKCGRLEHG